MFQKNRGWLLAIVGGMLLGRALIPQPEQMYVTLAVMVAACSAVVVVYAPFLVRLVRPGPLARHEWLGAGVVLLALSVVGASLLRLLAPLGLDADLNSAIQTANRTLTAIGAVLLIVAPGITFRFRGAALAAGLVLGIGAGLVPLVM